MYRGFFHQVVIPEGCSRESVVFLFNNNGSPTKFLGDDFYF